MPEPKLEYYLQENLNRFKFSRVDFQRVIRGVLFFKSDSEESIFENVKELKNRKCAGFTHVNKFEIGKKQKFRFGESFEFEGVPVGKVFIEDNRTRDYFKIKITENLYFYCHINAGDFCAYTEIIE